MDANDYVMKLKADGSKNDMTDLDAVFNEYKAISAKLATKDKGTFSLNVLCILCRNLEKVPSWSSSINHKVLLTLTIECVRESRILTSAEQVKALACICHIHRHAVRLNSPVPPELILKLSYMPFDCDNILKEYSKTYWSILSERIFYLERLKANKMNIMKLFPKLIDDILKVIKIYKTQQFCSTVLTYLVKKLHFLFSDLNVIELNQSFVKIFEEISSKDDMKDFKKLPDKEIFDIYTKLNDCLYVIAENASKNDFNGAILNTVVQTLITVIGHFPDLLYCVQNIYLNGFCSILSEKSNLAYTETVLNSLKISCETSEKLGYTKAMKTTYSYINQLLRLYIEYNCTKKQKNWVKMFPESIQIACLNLIDFLLKKLKSSEQVLKCENCTVKSGLHDALRLSFLVKNFVTISIEQKMSISAILPIYYSIIQQQYEILKELCTMGCVNYEKCYRKLQSDVHNTAILLNKSQNYEFSVKLFNIYVKNEVLHFKKEDELKNISRALYNKSICELDSKNYEDALSDAYLSLIFAYPDGLSTEKHMSLVMDIKAKELKSRSDDDEVPEDLQMTTVLDACAEAVEQKKYGNLKPFFCNLKFSELLKHEFEMYAKLWPSILPVAAVWKTLWALTGHDVPWTQTNDDLVHETLHGVVLRTPCVVRSIHNEHFVETVNEMLAEFQSNSPSTTDQKMFYATLLFLKSEYNFAEAIQKYGWKSTEPDQPTDHTLQQEYECMSPAVTAVHLWNGIVKELHTVKNKQNLRFALQTAQVLVPQLLVLDRTVYGLQLGHICTTVAVFVDDRSSYLQNASSILYLANKQTQQMTNLIEKGNVMCAELLKREESQEVALVYLCDCAMYYQRIGVIGLSARLIQSVQAIILSGLERNPDINLDLAIGHLLEAINLIHKGESPTMLTAVIGAHRHYLTATNIATNWSSRRHRSLSIKLGIVSSARQAILLTRGLSTLRRAAAVLAATRASMPAGGVALVPLTVDPACTPSTQSMINNRLKYYLGVQPSTHQPMAPTQKTEYLEPFTPKRDLETMLDNMTFKKTQSSPSSPCQDVPGFRLPEFLTHTKDCQCYLCENKYSSIIICMTAGLEASMYFRAKEIDIARNYFAGALKCLILAETKIKDVKNNGFEEYANEITNKILNDEFCRVRIDLLIETAFFELSQMNHKKADELIIRIHEILQEYDNANVYLKNEVLNLMTTAAYLRKKTSIKVEDFNLESEFENLKLSPQPASVEIQKTPESKPKKPPQIEKIKVKDEEVPKSKFKSIKLNLEEVDDDKEVNTKKVAKKTAFKIPIPITAKPVLESITPTPRRKMPMIIVTEPSSAEASKARSEFATPKPKNVDKTAFFTPAETPNEQFFTPMSTLKTYSKKHLRKDVVKNLETEFATPKSEVKKTEVKKPNAEVDKENVVKEKTKTKKVETGSLKTLKDKRTLKRATSPGKLEKVEKNEKPVRASRLRKPVRFSLDDNE